jgi:hypothetical protein
MFRGAVIGDGTGTTAGARRLAWAVALVAVVAVLDVSLAHLIHQHPHTDGTDLSCVQCNSPLGEPAEAPALAPPAARPVAAATEEVAVVIPLRTPLSFSPKQSPPAGS